VLPEHPELTRATVAEVAAATGARVLVDGGGLDREVRAVRVGAMSVDHFVDDIVDGTLVIVPGDRADILLASFAAAGAAGFPAVAGLLLTGGYPPAASVRRLLGDAPFPVLEVDARTYPAVSAVSDVRPSLATGDERRLTTALGVFEAGVDTQEIERRLAVDRPRRLTPAAFEYELVERARANAGRIVLPESEDDRILRAAEIVLRRGVAELTLLGKPETVQARAATLGLNLEGADVVDPQTALQRAEYAAAYHELRRHKGMTEELAFETLGDATYFATMMVHTGAAGGMVSGAAHTTADTIRPAFEFIRARPGVSVVSSVFFMCLSDRVLVYGDCAVNPQPDVEQLADIAATSADTAARFGIEPRVALLSYSTGASGKGADVDAVRAATEIVRERRPDLLVDGPVQYDAAVDPEVAKLKLPDSPVAGRATVLIFPDLESGNVAYKAVQRSSGALAVGPVLQGLNKPVNDLSRGCTVPDIVNTVAITAVQAGGGARSDSRSRSVMRAHLLADPEPG
jgi:phosphate acetyltransferase